MNYQNAIKLLLVVIIICFVVIIQDVNMIIAERDKIQILEQQSKELKETIKTLEGDVIYYRDYAKTQENLYLEVLEKLKEFEDMEYMGNFKVTWYTAGVESTGKTPDHPEYGITATGETVKEGVTVAADWNVLSPGTNIYIEGIGKRIVQDRGGKVKGNHVDVYIPNLEEIDDKGISFADVYIIN